MRDLFLDAQHNLRDRWQSAHANADMIMRCDIEKGIVGIAKMSNFMAGFGMIAAAGVVEVKCRRSEVEHFVTRPCRDSPLIIIGINSFVLRQDHGNFFLRKFRSRLDQQLCLLRNKLFLADVLSQFLCMNGRRC